MLKIAIGLGVAALVAMSAPSKAGTPAAYAPISLCSTGKAAWKKGVASWYGEEFQGDPTASGEAFNMNALTAAHRNLPLGTEIKVTNLRNHRSLVLRVNDRGPFIPGRMLDVSRAAARRLGFAGRGLAPIRIDVVKLPKDCQGESACRSALLAMN
ncbi:MAG: septal ring lytic transglycosylase RlpA family protein [Terriglobia bacterium]